MRSSCSADSGPRPGALAVLGAGFLSRDGTALETDGSNEYLSFIGGSSRYAKHRYRVPGDHHLFIGLHDTYRHAAGVAGYHGCAGLIASRMNLDAKKRHVCRDALPYLSGVLADAASKNQGIEPTEYSDQSTERLSGDVAIQIHRLCRMRVRRGLAE